MDGSLPDSWALLRNLTHLNVTNTLLSGEPPAWLLHMRANSTVTLHGTALNCTRPGGVRIDPPSTVVGDGVEIQVSSTIFICDPCTGEPPLPTAVCMQGGWFVEGTVLLPNGSPLNLTTPIIVNGDFTQPPGTVIVVPSVDGGSPGDPLIIVIGTATIEGTLEITLGGGVTQGEVVVIEADDIRGNFSDILINEQTPSGCSLGAEQRVSGGRLTVLFAPTDSCGEPDHEPSSKRPSTAVIAGAAVGGVALVSIIIILVVLVVMRYHQGHWLWNARDKDGWTIR